MSRHRAVRNLDLAEELADDYDHDTDFLGMRHLLMVDDISPEDQDALEQALLAVIDTLGEPDECGISERRMKEALWETYFDAPAAVDLLMEAKEQEEAQARKRADGFTDVGTSAKAPRLQRTPAPSPLALKAASPLRSLSTASPTQGVAAAPKKLSKLQQKLQANREKSATGASGASGSTGLAKLLSSKSSTPAASPASAPASPATPVDVAPSGAQISTLFPRTSSLQPFSTFGQTLRGLGCAQTVSTHITLPKVSDAEMEQLQAAFRQLSPDDVVQQARQGTRLAR